MLHEDTLLDLKVISKEEHSKLRNIAKDLQLRSWDASVLPSWLGLESAQILAGLTEYIQRSGLVFSKAQQHQQPPAVVIRQPPVTDLATEDTHEDDYDKEDIEEMERNNSVKKTFFKVAMLIIISFFSLTNRPADGG